MKLVSCRFIFGSLILLLVDLLWVASSELTEYLYHEKNFHKPFFTAYIKSVMFSLYLFGFIFFDSWWSQKSHLNPGDYYSIVSDSDQQNLTLEDDDEDDDDDEEDDEEDVDHLNLNNIDKTGDTITEENIPNDNDENKDLKPIKSSSLSNNSHFISDSVWIPIKRCSDTSSLSGKSSETEDDEIVSNDGHVFIENINPESDKIDNSNIINKNKNISSSLSNVNFIRKTSSSKRSKRKNQNLIKGKLKKPKRLVRFSNLIEVRQLSDKHADDAFLSRLSYSSFMRILYQRNRQRQYSSNSIDNRLLSSSSSEQSMNYDDHHRNSGNKLTIRETSVLAFYFTWIWFAAHLSFHMGLQYSEAGLVNVLSSTTPLFTLLLGILFPSGSITDSLSLTKLLCVLLSISSVAMISNIEPINPNSQSSSLLIHNQIDNFQSTSNNNNNGNGVGGMKLNNETILPLGSIWSLCGAFFYSVYIVLMRYNLINDSMLNFPMFFGFIGFFSMIFMFPFLMLLNFTQIETFQWPSQDQWIVLLVNGFCGTVISEILWLIGCFMTSSLIGTISVSFTIPMAVFFDIFYKNIEYPRIFFLGTIPMFFSFIWIIIISQYERWDPILDLLEQCLYSIGSSPRKCSGTIRLNESNVIMNNLIEKTIDNDNHHHYSDKNNHSTNEIMDQNIITNNNDDDDETGDSNKSIKMSINNRRFLNGKKDSSDHHSVSLSSSSSSSSSSTTLSSSPPSSPSSSTTLRHLQFNKQRMADQNDHHHQNSDDDDEHNEQTKSLIDAAAAELAC